MTIAWVIGSTGLLGAAVTQTLREAGSELFSPAHRFAWQSESEIALQLAAAVSAFALRVGAAERWEIHWAAGVGTMGSSAADLAAETNALAMLLNLLRSNAGILSRPGKLSFASSAGAIYAGTTDGVICENSAVAPTTAYADEKLKQEELVRAFVAAHPGVGALIARISTIYGPSQIARKKQGLLGHMARCILRQQPIRIYVPYDTMRDYIDATDAATAMVGTLRAIGNNPRLLVKIIASESPTTIAEIVAIFSRLARRAPRIVRAVDRVTELYPRQVQFRSIVASDYSRPPCKRLPLGIAQVMMAERLAFIRTTIPLSNGPAQ